MAKRYIDRYDDFCRSLTALEKTRDFANKRDQYTGELFSQEELSELSLTKVIKDFELTFELAWKLMHDFLKEHDAVNYQNKGSAIDNIREAVSLGIVANNILWFDMHHDRNLAAHRYGQEHAEEIAERILNDYIPVLEDFRGSAGAEIEKIRAGEKFKTLSDELIPISGRADTVAGEILRAFNYIEGRFRKDGAHIGGEVGGEACRSAARFLMARAGEKAAGTVGNLLKMDCDDDDYNALLVNLRRKIFKFIETEHPELTHVSNTEDMQDF